MITFDRENSLHTIETAHSAQSISNPQFDKNIEEVFYGVEDGHVLGTGISGEVRRITHRETGTHFALKTIDLSRIGKPSQVEQLRDEIEIMCELDHPNIVRLEEVYESDSKIYLVQELCSGGELFDALDSQPLYRYREEDCIVIMRQIISAVAYIHSRGIVHRDLKLENFLFVSPDKNARLQMIDFGLSKHFTFDESQHDPVGTPYTVAPEVIRGSYDERCDVWAIGVITYMLLCGDPPFGGCGGPEPLQQVKNNILGGMYKFGPDPIWDTVSKQAKEFISMLLITDPDQRPTAYQAQHSVWLRDCDKEIKPEVKKIDNNPKPITKTISKTNQSFWGWVGHRKPKDKHGGKTKGKHARRQTKKVVEPSLLRQGKTLKIR